MSRTDPLRVLTREDAYARVGGYEVHVPWRSAGEWIAVLRRDPDAAVLALSDKPDDAVLALATGDLSRDAVRDASRDLIKAETGRPWWVAVRLVYTSAEESVLGELTLSGVDPDRVSLGQWCACVYRILTRNADSKDRMKVDFELELPPPGEEAAWDDGNDFTAMAELAAQYEG